MSNYGPDMQVCMRLLLLLLCTTIFYLSSAKRARVIKSYNDATVYTYKGGVKRPIPDWNTFVSMGYDVSQIENFSAEEIAAIPTADSVAQIKEERIDNPIKDCPCVSNAQYKASIDNSNPKQHHLICLVDNEEAQILLRKYDSVHMKIHHRLVPANTTDYFSAERSGEKQDTISDCDVVVHLTRDETAAANKYSCPEMCLPVPITTLPLAWLLNSYVQPEDMWMPITCSMTFYELWNTTEFAEHHSSRTRQFHSSEAAVGTVAKEASSVEEGHSNSMGFANLPFSDRKRRQLYEAAADHQVAANMEHEHTSVGLMLKAIARRRIQECNERHLWSSGSTSVSHDYRSVVPRKVHGLIIWVGSRSRYSLMQQQIEILSNQTMRTPERVLVGWMASEDQYGCAQGSTLCYDVGHNGAYYPGMPQTRLNMAAAGWACAQRRQLRAMAHTLLLYDPNFMLVVDDDTFVNMGMLEPGGKLDKFIRRHLNRENVVYGELNMGKKVTKRGFYYGGSGYLIGREVVESLNGYLIHGPGDESDGLKPAEYVSQLSVFNEAWAKARAHCKSCMRPAPDSPPIGRPNAVARLEVRLIEVCANLMSQEHTCFHSDHAVSRCLFYGANAHVGSVACHGGSELDPTTGLTVAMCMGTDICTREAHLTCHRWYPEPDNFLVPKNMYAAYVQQQQQQQ